MLLLPQNLALWGSDVGVGPDFEQKLAQIPGVGTWTGVRYARAQVNGASVQVLGIDPATYPKVAALAFDQGDASAYRRTGPGAHGHRQHNLRQRPSLNVGDTVNVTTPDGVKPYQHGRHRRGLPVVTSEHAVTSRRPTWPPTSIVSEDVLVMANLAPGADRERGAARHHSAAGSSYPQFTLAWGADFRATQRARSPGVLAPWTSCC